MKRFLLLVLSLAITVFGMALVGCQPTTPTTQPPHEHIWETTYSSDNFSHWIKCEGCDEVKDIADHNLQNSDTCSVCGTTTVPPRALRIKSWSKKTLLKLPATPETATRSALQQLTKVSP